MVRIYPLNHCSNEVRHTVNSNCSHVVYANGKPVEELSHRDGHWYGRAYNLKGAYYGYNESLTLRDIAEIFND